MHILIYLLIFYIDKYLSIYVLYSEAYVILTTSSDSLVEHLQSLCRATCCEKGFLSLISLVFTHVPPVVTDSKLIARAKSLEIQLSICVDKFIVLFL